MAGRKPPPLSAKSGSTFREKRQHFLEKAVALFWKTGNAPGRKRQGLSRNAPAGAEKSRPAGNGFLQGGKIVVYHYWSDSAAGSYFMSRYSILSWSP